MDVRVGPKEGWGPKNWCLWIVGLEKILESSLDCKEIKPVNPKGNQLWIFIGRTDAEAEAPIFWPRDAQSQLIGKDPDNWEKLKAKGEEGGRKWNELTQWTWIWANSGRWRRTGEPGMQSMRSKKSDPPKQWNNSNSLGSEYMMLEAVSFHVLLFSQSKTKISKNNLPIHLLESHRGHVFRKELRGKRGLPCCTQAILTSLFYFRTF